MKGIIVDDENVMLNEFKRLAAKAPNLEIIAEFNNPAEVEPFAKEHKIDVAFLDIEMPLINGIELAKRLRKIRSDMLIVFITAYSEYIRDANDVEADYYLMKPFRENDIVMVMDKMKQIARRMKKRVWVQTFDMFEVFIDGKTIVFPTKKTKELLAFLVDRRGSLVTEEQIYAALWSAETYSHNNAGIVRKTRTGLKELLESYGVENILVATNQGWGIVPSEIGCDYYDFLVGKEKAREYFGGSYMPNYSWAKSTCMKLNFMGRGGETLDKMIDDYIHARETIQAIREISEYGIEAMQESPEADELDMEAIKNKGITGK